VSVVAEDILEPFVLHVLLTSVRVVGNAVVADLAWDLAMWGVNDTAPKRTHTVGLVTLWLASLVE